MKTRKAVSSLFVFIASASILAACGGAGDNEDSTGSNGSGSEGSKTVEFMQLWREGSSAQHHKIVNEIMSDFEEENPDINVDGEVLRNEQYKDKIKVLSTSDELPDVGMTSAARYMERYVEGDMYASLDDVIDEDDFVSGTLDAFSVDDTTHGIPLELNISSVFYTGEIFDEYGLDEPETLEELKDVVSTLNDNGEIGRASCRKSGS